MTRRAFLATAAILACPAVSAQQPLRVREVPGPTRDAGTYHVGTGTWTRGAGSSANIGPDTVYRNDAPSGYFTMGWPDCWAVEEVMLPGPDSPRGGPQHTYLVDGVSFAYCKMGAGTVNFFRGAYDSYVPCDDPTSPLHCIDELPGILAVPGLPGGSACWTVTVDLSGGYELCFDADGGGCAPGYDGNDLERDHGGIGFAYNTSDGGTAGPILAGDPVWKPLGDGTCYQLGFGNACGATNASGLGLRDVFSLSNHNGFPCWIGNNCYFFGGYSHGNGCGSPSKIPIAGFQMALFTDCTDGSSCDGTFFVYCDEAQNPNNTADIDISSTDSGDASILVWLSGGPPNQFGYLLVGDGNGTVSQPPGAKGDLCIVGGACLGRFDKDIFKIDGAGRGETDIQSFASDPCKGAFSVFPGASWNFQYWHRQPLGQAATFSAALGATFQ